VKLKRFNIKHDYIFDLCFEDGTSKILDLENLLKYKVSKDEIKTAHIDKEWGCLEFKNGLVDIEPNTLYNLKA